MWVAATLPSVGVLRPTVTGHADEDEALVAAHDRSPRVRDRWVVYEIDDQLVLPGWSRREEPAA